MNVCSLIGRLTRDPELRYTPNTNQAVITFTIAVDKGLSREKREEMEAKGMPTADFISIVAWGRTAENISNYASKGNMVGVTGRIQSRTYEAKDGTKRYVTEVIASSVEFLERKNITSQAPNQSHEDYFNSDEDFSNIDDGFAPGSNRDIPF